ncbi:haloacid dehalogenase type II [Saccharata proteae CBS 121410]|uniref:Haloacid dehalogenase type II n=1 Tax=Saccharata proteae CBS 121410 TaxID=1314787 RepID=A0A9P4HTI6_9PEZI|nr:haloacid dehalogenase type II [Saccharata proteae CBS 121410]
MISFTPKYITFDCYGTLINFTMSALTRSLYAPTLITNPSFDMDRFLSFFTAYRLDECFGPYKPYKEVIASALRRTCARFDPAVISYDAQIAEQLYAAVPTWGPHPDVPEGLQRLVAKGYKLVILSNAADEQIMQNVAQLGAEFHAVVTAEQVKSYKPRMQGFEMMYERLGCRPEETLHVSSSLRYDLIVADGLGVGGTVLVKRAGEPEISGYGVHEVNTIGELADWLGC